MVTASRSVSSLEDHIFQGVVGMDTNIAYLVEPLADVDAAEDSYSFMIDGNNGEIMAHPKLREIIGMGGDCTYTFQGGVKP